MIAFVYKRDTGADLLDDTSALMTNYDGQLTTPIATNKVYVAMTDCGCDHTYFDLAGLWRIDLDLFDHKRLPKFVTYGCFHRHPPLLDGLDKVLEHCTISVPQVAGHRSQEASSCAMRHAPCDRR
jgi:hypothetical protein